MHDARVKLWRLKGKVVVERPFRENGADRIYNGSAEVDFCPLKCALKSCMSHNGLRLVRIMTESMPHDVKKIKPHKLIKRTQRDVFSSYLVIFPATL